MGPVNGFGDVIRWTGDTLAHPSFTTDFFAALFLVGVLVVTGIAFLWFAIQGRTVVELTDAALQDQVADYDGRVAEVYYDKLEGKRRVSVRARARFTALDAPGWRRWFGLHSYSTPLTVSGRGKYGEKFGEQDMRLSGELQSLLKRKLSTQTVVGLKVEFLPNRNLARWLIEHPVSEVRLGVQFALWTTLFSTFIAVILTVGL